jgi:hypothetical protein
MDAARYCIIKDIFPAQPEPCYNVGSLWNLLVFTAGNVCICGEGRYEQWHVRHSRNRRFGFTPLTEALLTAMSGPGPGWSFGSRTQRRLERIWSRIFGPSGRPTRAFMGCLTGCCTSMPTFQNTGVNGGGAMEPRKERSWLQTSFPVRRAVIPATYTVGDIILCLATDSEHASCGERTVLQKVLCWSGTFCPAEDRNQTISRQATDIFIFKRMTASTDCIMDF